MLEVSRTRLLKREGITMTNGMDPKNVVLVHGGFVDGSGWRGGL
jgi:hypothetical protein